MRWRATRSRSNGEIGAGWEYWIKSGCSQQSAVMPASHAGEQDQWWNKSRTETLDMARLGVSQPADIGRSPHTVLWNIIGSIEWWIEHWVYDRLLSTTHEKYPLFSDCWFWLGALVLFWPLSALPTFYPFSLGWVKEEKLTMALQSSQWFWGDAMPERPNIHKIFNFISVLGIEPRRRSWPPRLAPGSDRWSEKSNGLFVTQEMYIILDHVSINLLQTLMSLLRNKKQINNIPITIGLSVMAQPSVSVGWSMYPGMCGCDPDRRSGIFKILTMRQVQPVKCWVLWPFPVAGLYCSHAKPVSFQDLNTVFPRFSRSSAYISRTFCWYGPGCWASSWSLNEIWYSLAEKRSDVDEVDLPIIVASPCS